MPAKPDKARCLIPAYALLFKLVQNEKGIKGRATDLEALHFTSRIQLEKWATKLVAWKEEYRSNLDRAVRDQHRFTSRFNEWSVARGMPTDHQDPFIDLCSLPAADVQAFLDSVHDLDRDDPRRYAYTEWSKILAFEQEYQAANQQFYMLDSELRVMRVRLAGEEMQRILGASPLGSAHAQMLKRIREHLALTFTIPWKGSIVALTSLLECLARLGLIGAESVARPNETLIPHFSCVQSGSYLRILEPADRIPWLGTQTELVFLLHQMHVHRHLSSLQYRMRNEYIIQHFWQRRPGRSFSPASLRQASKIIKSPHPVPEACTAIQAQFEEMVSLAENGFNYH